MRQMQENRVEADESEGVERQIGLQLLDVVDKVGAELAKRCPL